MLLPLRCPPFSQLILSIDDHGEVMFNIAQCALRVMRGYQGAHAAKIKGEDHEFEMLCAQLNNSVTCYNQSLEFAEDVQVCL